MNKGEYKFTKPQIEESFWPENETNLSELDPKNLTIDATTMSTEKGIAISTEGEYEMDAKGVINPTKLAEKPLSEVEKAQASVQEWKTKVESFQKELHFAKKNLKVHEWALKKLQEINL